jgi:hypothetical protein
MTAWSIVLILSVIVLGVSAFGLFARRSRARDAGPADSGARRHRDEAPRQRSAPGAPPDPGAAPAPMAGGAASAPMPRAAVAMNWNAIGAITGVLGLVVSVIGLFKG